MAVKTIAVVGAGIGGLAFGAFAARAGRRVVVFDQFKSPAPVGSGLVIQPVGQAVLADLGAGAAALALGNPVRRMLGHEARSGRKTLDVSYDLTGTDRFGLAIHRAALFQVLLDTARAAGVDLRSDHRVLGRNGQRLEFAHGTDGPFDLIVDAAGAGSVLSPLKARGLGYGAIWGTVPWPKTDLSQDHLSQWYRRADHMIGALPIGQIPGEPRSMAAIFWSLPVSGYDKWRTTPVQDWKAQARSLWPAFAPFLDTITMHDQMTMARYSHGTLRRPAADGIAHIGDAAHRASPQLGQGANMALLDAQALWGALQQNHHLPDALACYVKARRWHVALYQAMSWAFTPMYQSHSTVLPALRDHVLAPLSQVPPLARILSKLVCGDLIPTDGSLRGLGQLRTVQTGEP